MTLTFQFNNVFDNIARINRLSKPSWRACPRFTLYQVAQYFIFSPPQYDNYQEIHIRVYFFACRTLDCCNIISIKNERVTVKVNSQGQIAICSSKMFPYDGHPIFLVFQMFQDGVPLCRHHSDFFGVCTWLYAYVSIHDGKYMAVYTYSCYQRSHLFFHILDPCTIAESFFKTKVLYAHYFFLNLGACHCLETMEVDSLLQQLRMTLLIKITYYQS